MKRVGIIGGSESGVGAALLALKQGMKPFVSDGGQIKDSYLAVLNQHNIDYEQGNHSLEKLAQCDLIVKSPGVPNTSAVITHLTAANIKIVSEIEFGSLYYTGKVLAITGSNGKTTTAGLLYHTLEQAGLDVAIAGNYGYSFAGLVAERQPAYIVLEISSFQLDEIDTFKPYVSTILNITPDHLDRYEYKFENYIAAKFRIIKNQGIGDYFIYNNTDNVVTSNFDASTYTGTAIGINKVDYANGALRSDNKPFELTLKGQHNYYNAATVVAMCRVIGLSDDKIAVGLSTFVNQPHRLELVASVNGVDYINDSKATNVDSVFYALDAMTKPIIWIAGGQDKGNDYSQIKALAQAKVKALICMGKDNSKLEAYFTDIVPVVISTNSIVNAITEARSQANEGDVVLLSPACASFDLFKSYIDRGDQFKQQVLSLTQKITA